MGDRTGALTITLTCFVLTFCAACWWKNFGLALLFFSLQVLSFLWLLSHFNWDRNHQWFHLCFNIGLGCTFLGVVMLRLPLVGLKLFRLFYTLGTVCSLGSILLLMEPLNLETIRDKTKDVATKMKHDTLTHIKTAFEWLKNEADGRVLDAFDCGTHTKSLSEFFDSDVGNVLLGLCALLFPLLGLALFLGYVLGNICTLGILPGLMMSFSITKFLNLFRNPTTNTNQPQRMDINGKELVELPDKVAELRHVTIKIGSFSILSAVWLSWKLAFLFWVFQLIFWLIDYCLSHIRNFAMCFLIGAGCIILSVWVQFLPGIGLTPFWILFTLGNICILQSTLFLESPSKQLEKMFDDTRAEAITAMITFLVLTLASVFWWKSFVLALTFCILYILSSFWYCLSYIPCARWLTKKIASFFIRRQMKT